MSDLLGSPFLNIISIKTGIGMLVFVTKVENSETLNSTPHVCYDFPLHVLDAPFSFLICRPEWLDMI